MKRRGWIDALFIFPCAFAFIMVIIVPFGLGIYYAMTDWNGVNPIVNWVGLSNFQGMFSEPQFIYSFLITLMYTAINVVFVNIVGFGLALLVTGKLRLRNIYRAGFFVPNLIGGIVLGYIWQFIFNNVQVDMGNALGIAFLQKSLISRPDTVIWAMSVVNTWQYAGYIMMIYVASIQSIPGSVMEAASVDGANFFQRVRRILIPMMASAFTITLFLTLTNSFKQFDLNFTLTNGGPAMRFMAKPIRSSQLLAMDIYRTANQQNLMAQAQAKAVIFFIVLVIFSLTQVYLNKRKELEA
ncbi:MAG TPA: sugar ABC transporter permease [Clostridia bacterium]|jgi:raffinose/stachyose/melibiose transport system permease protein|nr:sugar ABC transporter permease [Clostridia bacterium]HPA60174.1 sugar ABC transporter permease [Clostridia bacterium]HPY43494.1 sugar ABC transporter permease [Clostridia bacterium]HQA96330.1 sugar ABC transporter permease [Clostridia bacterium]HQO56218.1 sugar ABC transporter permease [Clostridia bacterium]